MIEDECVYIWRVYHPNNLNPERFTGKHYPEPITGDKHEYLMESKDNGGRFHGHLIATLHNQTPTLTNHWNDKGWRIESKGRAKRIEITKLLNSPNS